MELVKFLEPVEQFNQLRHEILNIVSHRLDNNNQIILQTLDESVEDWYCGIGKVAKLQNFVESDYKFIQPSLKGSVIETVIKKYGGYRTRIMNMLPKSCYSVHSDNSYRIHIPITTNSHSWMVWPKNQYCYSLHEGNAYWTNTKVEHSFFNGAMSSRLHLVMCVT
jgi:hypothetical protein